MGHSISTLQFFSLFSTHFLAAPKPRNLEKVPKVYIFPNPIKEGVEDSSAFEPLKTGVNKIYLQK